MKIKTLDITVKEWFDKVNGNSYFSAQATINYGMKNAVTLYFPYEYGYGNHGENQVWNTIKKSFKINDIRPFPFSYCEENKIIYRYNKIENCKKAEIIAYGKGL